MSYTGAMNQIYEVGILAVVGVFGAVIGSFMLAQVWRLRAWQLRQLAEDELTDLERKEKQQLESVYGKKRTVRSDRSVCLSCGHQLAWYDLIPVCSWLWLRGKCRYCKAPIGKAEFAAEVGLAAAYVLTTLLLLGQAHTLGWALWPSLLLVLAGEALLLGLFVFDCRWYLLPDRLVFPFAGLGLGYALVHWAHSGWQLSTLWSGIVAIGVLSGLYYALYLFSKGAWVGLGDVKLGLGLALFLPDWRLAFLALFAANLLGTLIFAPLQLFGKLPRGQQVPFGPLLIAGFLLVFWGQFAILAFLQQNFVLF